MALRTKSHWFRVALDAPDARELARFYQRLLGWTIISDEPDWVTVAPSEHAGYNLAFQTERNYVRPVWPSEPGKPLMMMHLDLEVDVGRTLDDRLRSDWPQRCAGFHFVAPSPSWVCPGAMTPSPTTLRMSSTTAIERRIGSGR